MCNHIWYETVFLPPLALIKLWNYQPSVEFLGPTVIAHLLFMFSQCINLSMVLQQWGKSAWFPEVLLLLMMWNMCRSMCWCVCIDTRRIFVKVAWFWNLYIRDLGNGYSMFLGFFFFFKKNNCTYCKRWIKTILLAPANDKCVH